MTQPTKPSAGAVRAAREILDTDHQLAAHIIDRETGVGELLEAAKQLSSCLLNLCAWPNSERGTTIKATITKLEQAIAKCVSLVRVASREATMSDTKSIGKALSLQEVIYNYLKEHGSTDNLCWYDATIGAKQLSEGLSSLCGPYHPERDKLARELAERLSSSPYYKILHPQARQLLKLYEEEKP